jgi:hypothetical protein
MQGEPLSVAVCLTQRTNREHSPDGIVSIMSSYTQTTGGWTYEYWTKDDADTDTTTKYRTGYEPYEVTVDGRELRFVDHSLERWDERTPCWSMAPTTALSRSVPLEWIWMGAFRTEDNEQPHMVYYVAELGEHGQTWYDALFLMVDSVIKTVYETSFVDDPDKQPIHGYIGQLREEMLAQQTQLITDQVDGDIDRIDTKWS